MSKSRSFSPSHHDRVTVLATNFTGTRILTGSIDHRLKIWDRNPKTGDRRLLDTFTAHDSDVRDARFLHPTLGSHIVSIGNDLKCHVWTEQPSQAPNSGHRFRRTTTIQSTPRIPFVSLDVKTLDDNVSTLLALVDRQGLLSIYEPTNPDDLREWTLVDGFYVTDGGLPLGRGEEGSFKVRFDPNPAPLAWVNGLSADRSQVGLVVSVLNEVKVYRSVVPADSGGGEDGGGGGISNNGASHRVMFYEAARLPAHPGLVRDVAWAPFSVRGSDRLATACKDGAVRIFELGVVESQNPNANSNTNTAASARAPDPSGPRNVSTNALQVQQPAHRPQQSSLTTAITGRAAQQHQQQQPPNSSHSGATSRASRTTYSFAFSYHTVLLSTSTLPAAHSDAWSLTFDSQGQVLMSTGADGVTKIWRKSVLEGRWLAFADVMGEGDEDGESEDEGSEEGDSEKDDDSRD